MAIMANAWEAISVAVGTDGLRSLGCKGCNSTLPPFSPIRHEQISPHVCFCDALIYSLTPGSMIHDLCFTTIPMILESFRCLLQISLKWHKGQLTLLVHTVWWSIQDIFWQPPIIHVANIPQPLLVALANLANK